MKQKTKVALNAFACGSLYSSMVSSIMREGWYAGKFRDLPQQDKNWWEVKPRHRRTRYANFPVGL